MKPSSKLVWGFLTVLVILALVYALVRYTSAIEFFSSPISCRFVTLGTYRLTTTLADITSTDAKGLIYISGISTTPVNSDWSNITHADDQSYSYTKFTPKDSDGVDVKSLINSVMKCKNIPEFTYDLGINTNPALILCLQSYTPAVGTTAAVLSRVFFVKCFVPSATVADSNRIVGEIAGNTIATYYSGGPQPVAVIQGAVGVPSLTATYTLSYTVCAAGNRPEGFSYTDCCSAIDSSTQITSYAISSSDYTGNCVSTGNKDKGETCSVGTDCSSGTCTNSKCVESSSSGNKSNGQSCSEKSDCATGLSCSNNVCRVQQTLYCSNHPNSYDPDHGIPCSQEIGTYSASDSKDDSKGSMPRWQNWDWGTKDDDDIYDAEDWYGSKKGDKDEDEDKDSNRASKMWREWLENSRGNPESKDSKPSSTWSGTGNRWRGSSKDMSDQLENIRPQRFSNSIIDSRTMQPSLATCNKFYICKKTSDTADEESCE